MNNFNDILVKYRKYYGKVCKKHAGGYEKMPLNCACDISAQINAYIEYVLPENYSHLEINDFHGMKNGKQVIPPSVVIAAKKSIIEYCWKDITVEDPYDPVSWWNKSIIDKRKKEGSSVIVYGNQWQDNSNKSSKMFKNPIGKTLIASIIMKEAIRRRASPSNIVDTYQWVSYNRLNSKLMEQASKQYNEDTEISNYEDCDWLVVDGFEIEKQSDATRSFKARVLDNFFDERIKYNKPNILVFQDDLSIHDDLSSEFGKSVNSIINSQKTVRIKLLNK
jgi:hypothetical protein